MELEEIKLHACTDVGLEKIERTIFGNKVTTYGGFISSFYKEKFLEACEEIRKGNTGINQSEICLDKSLLCMTTPNYD